MSAQPDWTKQAPPMRDTSLAPEHVTSTVPRDYRQVHGWGVDLDPKNRPMFPMELPSDVMTARGEVSAWQVPHQKIHNSIEHPNLTPVFGTSCPPKGLSGLMRDYAYHYSEGTNRHWMTLIFADRVDMLESMIGALLRGKPDNYIREKGWNARVTYGDSKQVTAIALGAAAIGALLVGALVWKSNR
jgi:hypothetical protein